MLICFCCIVVLLFFVVVFDKKGLRFLPFGTWTVDTDRVGVLRAAADTAPAAYVPRAHDELGVDELRFLLLLFDFMEEHFANSRFFVTDDLRVKATTNS